MYSKVKFQILSTLSPKMANFPNFAGSSFDSVTCWRENSLGVWAAATAVLVVVAWKLLVVLLRYRGQRSVDSREVVEEPGTVLNPSSNSRISKIITDADLVEFMKELDPKNEENELWEDVIDKKSDTFSYNAKCCRPKDGPLKYLSVTTFEKCDTELLRDFYMDNEYRLEWDKTFIGYKQLEVDELSGTEIGQLIKKYTLLTPREYILAWRVWEGKDNTFYCISKDCEHSQEPQLRKYVRVNYYRCSWRIRKIPGRDACEITLLNQQDAGLNVEMAKLAFSRGIWSYMCKMNNALRSYSPAMRSRSPSVAIMLKLIKKVPPGIEMNTETSSQIELGTPVKTSAASKQTSSNIASEWKQCSKTSKLKLIANGLLLVGGIACLSKGRAAIGTQVAMACILKKFIHGKSKSNSGEVVPTRGSRSRQGSKRWD